ncbi:MAG TPA: SDR family oxidoreductase [Candidatus Binatia bacterium]|nr:SDR family oxidoreductase [Candidatus Binatia bacterium]
MKNVLITGCSTGFGRATALLFARRGDRVFATMRSPEKGRDLTEVAERADLPLRVLRLDVEDPALVQSAIREATASSGPIDVLINNAGIELRSSIEDASEEDVRRQFETNVFGPLRTIRAVLPAMRERRSGTIVNVSSIAGLVSRPFGGFYAASKHALEAISEALHYEVQPFGIRVVLIEPGQYRTQLLDNAYTGRAFTPQSPYWERSSQFDEVVKRLVPGGEAPGPDDVAQLIHRAVHDPEPKLRYLAGDDAKMIAGAYRGMEFEAYEQAMRQALDWYD